MRFVTAYAVASHRPGYSTLAPHPQSRLYLDLAAANAECPRQSAARDRAYDDPMHPPSVFVVVPVYLLVVGNNAYKLDGGQCVTDMLVR